MQRQATLPERHLKTRDFTASPGSVFQYFVGTAVEYLPLSLVRDTCAVKVDRRNDVHSKQRVGDLPKPLRWGDTK